MQTLQTLTAQIMELENLQMQAELASRLFDEIPASVIVIDRLGKIIAVNKNFKNYTDKEEEAMVGRLLWDRYEIKNKILTAKYRQLLKDGTSFFGHVLHHYAELQNKLYTMSLSAVPLKNQKGEIIGAVSIAQDISFLSEANSELQESNAQLTKRIEDYSVELAQKQKQLEQSLTSRNRFFAEVSHELRTPLTIVKGNLDLIFLEEGEDMEPNFKEKLTTINEEVRRMSELLEDISFLNRTEDITNPLHKSLLNLDELVGLEVKEFLAPALKKDIILTYKPKPVSIFADQKGIRKIIRNLLSNALRYTPKGGKVKVQIYTKKDFAMTEVKDSGIGIGPEDLPHIFDRFYRSEKVRNRNDGGSGLGLAICEQIAKQHGGRIEVVSQLGKGTSFTLKLPLRPPQEGA